MKTMALTIVTATVLLAIAATAIYLTRSQGVADPIPLRSTDAAGEQIKVTPIPADDAPAEVSVRMQNRNVTPDRRSAMETIDREAIDAIQEISERRDLSPADRQRQVDRINASREEKLRQLLAQ